MRLEATERDGAHYGVDSCHSTHLTFPCGIATKTGEKPFTERRLRHFAARIALETSGIKRMRCKANDLFSALQGEQHG